jgi:hypothetical protein
MKTTINGQRGVSLLQAVAFLAVVILGGMAVFQATQTGKESLDKARSVGNAGVLADLSLDGLRSLLLETGVDKKGGVCRLFDTPLKTGGVGQIYVNVPVASANTLDSDWTRAFPAVNWDEETSAPECAKNVFTRCLKPKDTLGLSEDFRTKKPFVLLSLVPVEMRNPGNKAFQVISTPITGFNVVNARDVGFAISAQVFVREKEKDSPADNPRFRSSNASRTYASVWAGQISCGFTTDENNNLLLNPSAIGTGLGPMGTLFSAVGLTASGEDKILDVSFTQFENTRFKVTGNKMVSDYSAGAVSSICKEAVYRCGSQATGRTWSPTSLAVEARVKYLRNKKISANSIIAKPEIVFARVRADGSVSDIVRGTAAYFHSGAALPSGSMVTYLLSPRTLIARFTNSDSICSGICGQGNFNTAGDLYRPGLENTPRSDYSALGTKLGPQMDEITTTYCSCCAVKQCQRSGHQTTVHCPSLPPEPLDSRLAECTARDPATVYSSTSILGSLDSSTFAPNHCIVADMDRSGELKLIAESCGSTNPAAACYHQGGFGVAGRFGSTSAVSTNFGEGRALCYNQGQERLEKAELDEKLTLQGNQAMISLLASKVSGAFYDFVNNRSAGAFLAPESPVQIQQLSASMSKFGVSKAWVNLRTDSKRRVYAPPYTISVVSPLGYQFDAASRISVFQDNTTWTNGPQVIVAHSALLAVPIQVNTSVTSVNARFLCRRISDGQIFATTATSPNVSNGPAKCKEEGGLFLPPVRPLEWQYAFIQSAEPNDKYPWPTQIQSGVVMPTIGLNQPLWIGFRDSSGDNSGKWELNLTIPTGTTKIAFTAEGHAVSSTASAAATHRLCVTRSGPSGLTPTFSLMVATTATCADPALPYGPIDSEAILDLVDLHMFLAQELSSGAIGSASVIETNF